MNKGDRVMIYKDPLTRKRPEDKAVLIQRRSPSAQDLVQDVPLSFDGLERWLVKFDDGFTLERWI